VYLGAPGTQETHAKVEVRRGQVGADVWRLRSAVTVEGRTSESLLPERAPSRALELPTTYTIVAPGREGLLEVVVEALGEQGEVVGRGRGSGQLIPRDGIAITVDLGLPCQDEADCQDGLFCNGAERCMAGVCSRGDVPCPPSAIPCVQVACLEEEADCAVTPDHGQCAPYVDGEGTERPSYCDATYGCLRGVPDAPSLASPSVVTPSMGSAGTLFRVAFTVTEPLADDPLVRIDTGTRRAALSLDGARTRPDLLRYAFTYQSDGSETPGRRTITVDLVDLSGTTSTGLPGGEVLLDFSAPALAGPGTVVPETLRALAHALLTVTFTEDLPEPPEVRMAPGGTEVGPSSTPWLPVAGDAGPRTFGYAHQPTGTEEEGPYAVWVRATDAAGNTGGWVRAAAVVLDFRAPDVLREPPPRVLPAVAAVGRTVSVELQVTEPLAAPTRLVATDGFREVLFQAGQNTERLLTFLHTVEEGEDGTYDLVLSGLRDVAGNVRQPVTVGTAVFDGTPPGVLDFTQNLARLNASDTLVVTFRASEPLSVHPLVRFAGWPMTRVGTSDLPYTYDLPLVDTRLVGRFSVSVELADRVGNKAVLDGEWLADVDAVPPAMVDVVFTPPVARLGITAYLSITVTEPLAIPPLVAWSSSTGDPGFAYATMSGLTYTYGLDVSAGLRSGIYRPATVEMVDGFGNQVVAHPEADLGLVLDFTVDAVPPEVTRLEADRGTYSARAGFNTVVITFDVSEPVDTAPATMEVTVAGRAVPRSACSPRQDNHPNHTCRYTVTGTELEGVGLVTVIAKDRAGNTGVANRAVQLDFTPPSLVFSEVRPALAKLEDVVTYALLASEPLSVTPVVTTGGPGPVALEHVPGTSYTFRHVASLADVNGSYAILVRLTDRVGNVSDMLDGGTFMLDVTVPGMTPLTTDRARYSARTGFNLVTVTFDVSEPLDAPPAHLEVSLGFGPMTCTTWQRTSPSYTCTYNVTGHEPEGALPLLVNGVDAAGNRCFGNTSVLLDFTPPAVATGSVSVGLVPGAASALPVVTRVAVGTTVRLGFSATEPLLAGVWPEVATRVPARFVFTRTGGTWITNQYVLPWASDAAPQGPYVVSLSMTDAVGNPVTLDLALPMPGLVVDTVPPQVVAESGPPAATNQTAAAFRFHSSEEEDFTCRVDGDAPYPCTSPQQLVDLPEGPHTLDVAAVDGAGNAGPAHRWSWRVDLQSPTVTFVTLPPATTHDNDATFDFTCAEVGCTFQCRLDNADFLPCAPPHAVEGVPPGDHVLYVRASDPAGNTGPAAEAPWHVQGEWLQVASGQYASCAVAEGGTLWCWGSNRSGEVGDGTQAGRWSPTRVEGTGWVEVTTRESHVCGRKADGTLWCWGANGSGQLGDRTTTAKLAPTQVGSEATWLKVSAGVAHTCGLKEDGSLWCWGEASNGQLGTGATTDRTSPTRVGTATNWTDLSVGAWHTCALKTDHTLWCWGENQDATLGDGTTTDRLEPTRIGDGDNWARVGAGSTVTCALTSGGVLYCWGYNASGQVGDGTTTKRLVPRKIGTEGNWVTVDSSGHHTCGVDVQGSLWCWGHNANGRLGDGTQVNRWSPTLTDDQRRWVGVACGRFHTCAVAADGSAWCWGDNGDGQLGTGRPVSKLRPTLVSDEADWGAPVAGSFQTMARKSDGSLWGWGASYPEGRLATPNTGHAAEPTRSQGESLWRDVGVGWTHACGVLSAGSLWCWGGNNYGQLGRGNTNTYTNPVEVLASSDLVSLGLGNNHGCAVRGNGTLWCWGVNVDGQLGIGRTSAHSVPVQAGVESTWALVRGGGWHTCGLMADASLWCWGYGGDGQLGTGVAASASTAQPVARGATWTGVSLGQRHTCGVQDGGTLWCWGRNEYGQLGTGSAQGQPAPVPVGLGVTWRAVGLGFEHTCAVAVDGSLWCWGRNDAGQVGDGSLEDKNTPVLVANEGNWQAATGGSQHTCALAGDGRTWCWGSNRYGQVGDGTAWRERPWEVERQ
jgi:alpha-tubulin suppressor-like RCC1 family protein